MFHIENIKTKTSIKAKAFIKSKKLMKFSPDICKPQFYEKIIQKYVIFKRSNERFSNLIFLKSIETSLEVININNLNTGNSYFIPYSLFLEYIYWKHSGISSNALKLKMYESTPSLTRYSREKIKPDSDNISSQLPTPKLIPKLLYSEVDKTDNRWNTWTDSQKISSALKFKIYETSPSLTSYSLKKIKPDSDTTSSQLSAPILIPRSLYTSMEKPFGKWRVRTDIHKMCFFRGRLYSGQKLSKFILQKSEDLENSQKIVFPFWKRHPGQKSNKFTLNKYEEKAGKSFHYKASFPQKNIIFEFANLRYKNAAMYQAVVEHSGNDTVEDRENTVLRKPVRNIPKKTPRNSEENEPEYTLNDIIRTSFKKDKSSVVSPGEINTIANKVYKLLESKLLMEKERRGLR